MENQRSIVSEQAKKWQHMRIVCLLFANRRLLIENRAQVQSGKDWNVYRRNKSAFLLPTLILMKIQIGSNQYSL